MIKRLAHICINATDLNETLRFYTEVLGLEKGFEFERNGKLFGYYVKLGDASFIEVFQGDPGEIGNIKTAAREKQRRHFFGKFFRNTMVNVFGCRRLLSFSGGSCDNTGGS